jgi:hypothetical protein
MHTIGDMSHLSLIPSVAGSAQLVLRNRPCPTWPYRPRWGYGSSGGLGLVVNIVLVLVLTGRL